MASETDSVIMMQFSYNTSNNGGWPLIDIWDEYDIIDNGKGNYKGVRKVPRKIQFKVLRNLQSIEKSGLSKFMTLKKRKFYPSSLSMDTYYNIIKAIDKAKEAKTNQSLIK
ncbi:7177_t:CDS:2 [Dentiscutata erythropus]|uniref:7177_t:CDS:1 n=1 Tax=Dentiscutata erythropus TaxID=1348616 RepID=A0A9N8W5S7_9GLOM|nr:7177_t:CDS:2 [Dentiscutata erythropus]